MGDFSVQQLPQLEAMCSALYTSQVGGLVVNVKRSIEWEWLFKRCVFVVNERRVCCRICRKGVKLNRL